MTENHGNAATQIRGTVSNTLWLQIIPFPASMLSGARLQRLPVFESCITHNREEP